MAGLAVPLALIQPATGRHGIRLRLGDAGHDQHAEGRDNAERFHSHVDSSRTQPEATTRVSREMRLAIQDVEDRQLEAKCSNRSAASMADAACASP